MKKIALPLLLVGLTSASLQAQDMQETAATTSIDNSFNKWSIEVSGGANKPFRTLAPGYRTDRVNFFTVDLGTRYMFNNKFGLKLDFGYNQFQNNDETPEFKSSYVRGDIQGVINVGRVLNFEDWTSTIGLLAHGGGGVYMLKADDGFDGEDWGANLIGGLTAQFKLSDRIVLTADVTGIANGFQNWTFDGMAQNAGRSVDGVVLNGTLGLTFYLGGAEKHADWVTDVKSDELAALDERIGAVETMMNDSDKDGVPDYLDAEPNSTAGVAVDTKGRAIDRNNNGVPDELESYIENKTKEIAAAGGSGTDLQGLINGGYVNVYFDFNKDMPNSSSTTGINFLTKYLKENPSAKTDVIGYADEIGNSDYNKALSQRRAENVKKILVDSGIDASRLNIIGNGEDTSVNKDSKQARQVVRRVTFIIK
ncbi:OmpA family protein [Flavobacterium sp. DG1-102-2]|uniref:OmpA family protein n=1 Tax=Flavobacterium sp. DG1-102-2 TaxID=3081663 RepID=UPI00294950E8|nr:OmpA family protein [Flavobacterium sp. DG1-102-2]MDV6167313.1 OmpA family protein [Flavobacterium sp. DG1-102-2]